MSRPIGSSWGAPLQLFFRPWRLGEIAMYSHPAAACVAGSLSYGLPIAGFLWFFGVGINEPWGWWSGVAEEAVDRLGCFILPLAGITFLCTTLCLGGMDSAKVAAQLRCFMLAAVSLLFPVSIWLIAITFVTLNADVMNEHQWDALADSASLQLLSSCFWLPVFAVVWILTMGHGFVWIDRRMQNFGQLCLSCGYDLTGTRAAGITRCPECGAEDTYANELSQETADVRNPSEPKA